MSLNLFIIGPSGCGKSTQAKMISQQYNLTHLSMGQLLRNEIANNTELGLKAKTFVDSGNLVPDDIALTILTSNLAKINNQNFIIDGFPRDLKQGQFIENYLNIQKQPLNLVIHLDLSFEDIQSRRAKLGESFQDKARTDSSPKDILARQKFYDENNGQIMEYFQSKNLLFQTNGNRPIEPIFQDICQKINSLSQIQA